jgi:hypothetical protein
MFAQINKALSGDGITVDRVGTLTINIIGASTLCPSVVYRPWKRCSALNINIKRFERRSNPTGLMGGTPS